MLGADIKKGHRYLAVPLSIIYANNFLRENLSIHTRQKLFVAFGSAHALEQFIHRFFWIHII
jgi:hypothetical protein